MDWSQVTASTWSNDILKPELCLFFGTQLDVFCFRNSYLEFLKASPKEISVSEIPTHVNVSRTPGGFHLFMSSFSSFHPKKSRIMIYYKQYLSSFQEASPSRISWFSVHAKGLNKRDPKEWFFQQDVGKSVGSFFFANGGLGFWWYVHGFWSKKPHSFWGDFNHGKWSPKTDHKPHFLSQNHGNSQGLQLPKHFFLHLKITERLVTNQSKVPHFLGGGSTFVRWLGMQLPYFHGGF